MGTLFRREGNIIDVLEKRIFQGEIVFENGKIRSVTEKPVSSNHFLLPGLVDAHIHIESSMLVPAEFARLAVRHGTVATVSDPHEIANVLGLEGINFMRSNGATVPFKFFFGAPSCVPATGFESSGAHIGPGEIAELLSDPSIKYLSEMMNFPGVLNKDPEVMQKLEAARKAGKPVDGHAPGLKGDTVKNYIKAGITTDHECFTIDEARDKIDAGMKIQIREGSAAKNFDTLIPLLQEFPDRIMFCSDDKHPDDLLVGHINELVKKAVNMGYDLIDAVRACTVVPVRHYNLDVGLLREGDPADMIIIDNPKNFRVLETFIDGVQVSDNGRSLLAAKTGITPNIFLATPVSTNELVVPADYSSIRVIRALDGQLITKEEIHPATVSNNCIVSDPDRDILKMVVINRYRKSAPAIGFVCGFGLRNAALASTVAHDSHNIVAVGTSDKLIAGAINQLIETKGGIVLKSTGKMLHLPLPVGGIMSNLSGELVAKRYDQLNTTAKNLGTPLTAPFMTLSFMALLVIPEIKLSDKGLFNGNTFEFTSINAELP